MKISVLKLSCVCLLLMFCMSSTLVFAAQKVNINKATAVELVTLKGVGEKTALSIIEYRETHGLFKSIEDIVNVKGVGQKSFAKLAELITVTDEAPKQ
ncbi:ComEA family DNA-binding protein [Geopsychrobacter electrodiphilus]|uniref:ComEA family DNA-binding protein n=1 Tax=Geopsychrobacter electrodiphilus TaxID=225196 RepID=UPI00036DE3D2|nr:helix-hairpin-helix domain-containing protein [Geopsychrobacter electrodiphilus]